MVFRQCQMTDTRNDTEFPPFSLYTTKHINKFISQIQSQFTFNITKIHIVLHFKINCATFDFNKIKHALWYHS